MKKHGPVKRCFNAFQAGQVDDGLFGNLHEVLAQLLVDLIQALSGKILAFSGVT